MPALAESKLPEVAPDTDVCGYVVRARLGAGSFGTVYAARRGGALYALKLLPLAELGRWGEREVAVLSRVKHPNAVRLWGHGHWPSEAPRFFVVVMQYEAGRQLDVWARTENPSARQVVRLVLDVARALVAVHREKALHRDVKEANILVREADGAAVLVDFGVGTYEGAPTMTAGALPPGTRGYLSPEAWRFHREHAGRPGARYASTPADDVYALGVTLYWLLTDRKPFTVEGSGDDEAVLTREPLAPHVRNPRVPPELGELCLRLLAKSPEARPDARSLCVALKALRGREGAAWEEPLCDSHESHNVTTLPGEELDERAAWYRAAREDVAPRRGRRPLLVEQGEAPAPVEAALHAESTAPAAPAEVPAPTPATPIPASVSAASVRRAPGVRSWASAALALAVAAGALALGAAWRASSVARSPAPPAPAVALGVSVSGRADTPEGLKVAPPGQPPEAPRAAAPPQAASIPAARAPRAMPSQETAPVKTPPPQQRKQPAPRLGAAGKALSLAACTALAGCPSGPPVRPAPPSAPCPKDAVETMEDTLGIYRGDIGSVTFPHVGDDHWVRVREGINSLSLWRPMGKLPVGTVLTVHLFFAGDVYGRVTQARTPSGDTFPVCMDLRSLNPMGRSKPHHSSGPDKVLLWSNAVVKAVDEFE